MQLEVGQLQRPIKAILKPLFNLAWRVSTDGLENIPTKGGAIIAPNHLSVLDSFFVPCSLPRRITYVGKAEYLDDWKTKTLFPAMGMIPIDRRGGEHAQAALDAAAGVLNRGELFGIYPEGTRSRTGQVYNDSYATSAAKAEEPTSPTTAPASSSTVLTGAGGEVRHGRHLRTGTSTSAPGGATRPSSGSVLASRPLVTNGGSSPVPAPDPAAAREQANATADTPTESEDLLSRASSSTVLRPRPLTPA